VRVNLFVLIFKNNFHWKLFLKIKSKRPALSVRPAIDARRGAP
jgi:hypothetical protein